MKGITEGSGQFPSNEKTEDLGIIAGEEPRILLSNLLPKKSPTLASKKNISDVPIRDYLRGRCAAGISTNEDDVYYAFPSRYRRGDCLRMLKSFHQTYSANTELKVCHGLWVLSVKGSVQE